jgi:hypothetical protein
MNRRMLRRTSRALGFPLLLGLAFAQACGGEATVVEDETAGTAGVGDAPNAGSSTAGTAGASTAGRGGAGGRSSSGSGGSGGAGAMGGGIVVEGGGEGGAPENCGATAIDASPPEVNVLLVVDKSSSMNETGEFPEGRWVALGNALEAAMVATETSISYGLELFPFADDPEATPEQCQTPTGLDVLVSIRDGENRVAEIVDALETYEPAGGTPTADALARALDYFTDGDGKDLPGTNYVLLATDGGPNCNAELTCEESDCVINRENSGATEACNGSCCDASLDPDGPKHCLDDDRTVARVQALAEAGIKTIVVGIPGTEFFVDTLDALAEAGLAPNPDAPPSYYNVTSEDGAEGLTETLTRITTGLITTCRLQLTSTPTDPDYEDLLNVVIDGEEVPQAGDDGWDVDRSTTPPTVVLKGETCEYLETEGAENVTITYGCPTVIDPR